MYATTMSRPTINPRLWIIMAVMIALVSVSWEDAAQDQYDRMHGDDSGPACSMRIDWTK